MSVTPSTTLSIAGLDLTAGPRTLVSGLDLVVSDGDVTAVVGPNGSGKSTLLRTVAGLLPVVEGKVGLAPPTASIGWLPQEIPDPGESLLAMVRRRTGVDAADAELEAASDALASDTAAAGGSVAADRYDHALERWLGLGGADLEVRLPEVAARVGLGPEITAHAERPLGTLSGGQAARAGLVAILLSRHDVLLLDEPTNDLDRRGQQLIADFVRTHGGPVLIASHDRAFLDEVATSVVELDLPQQRIGYYAGGWSDYAQARELARRQAQEAYEGYADTRDRLLAQSRQREEFAAKGHRAVRRGDEADKHLRERDKARADRQLGKAARVKAAVERLVEVPQPRKEWQLQYQLLAGAPSADVVASLADAVVERGSFRLGPVSLSLERGDRVAVLGDNGSGKSTLLDALFGRVALTRGRVAAGARVRPLHLDQRRSLLDSDTPVLDLVAAELGEPDPGRVRTLLAKFGLGADHVHRPARSLSLGERTRALMAVGQGREVNLVVLDEPTNHLDVAAIEELERAVADFDGTLVVVSHDRRLLERLGITRTWRLEGGRVSVDAESEVVPPSN